MPFTSLLLHLDRRTARFAAALIALVTIAPGCLTVADDEGPILSIELYWDEDLGGESSWGTCDSAGVEDMQWELIDGNGKVVASNDDGGDDLQDCYNAIDVLDPAPGEYELVISGFDDDRQELWYVECSDMNVLRFDVAYRCDIEAP
jgi:hypothetical protein